MVEITKFKDGESIESSEEDDRRQMVIEKSIREIVWDRSDIYPFMIYQQKIKEAKEINGEIEKLTEQFDKAKGEEKKKLREELRNKDKELSACLCWNHAYQFGFVCKNCGNAVEVTSVQLMKFTGGLDDEDIKKGIKPEDVELDAFTMVFNLFCPVCKRYGFKEIQVNAAFNEGFASCVKENPLDPENPPEDFN